MPRGAGRTDAGVHALGQVAHFDLVREWPTDTVRAAVNFHLKPDPVVVLDCAVVPESFDARYSATARHYRYRILARRAPAALDNDRVWWVPQPLSAAAMHEAAQSLVGRHDFTTFRAAACQARSPVKTLDRLVVGQQGEEIVIEASARSFLHNQVRSIVGSLKLVGEGKWSAADLAAALAARDRAACGPVAPARGLYLVRVDYTTA
jgi:tRNA pseudouridine38-40 synthase